jgi:hypothetical protein
VQGFLAARIAAALIVDGSSPDSQLYEPPRLVG